MKHHVKVCVEGEKLQRECGQCHKRFKHNGHYEVHVKGCGLDNKTVSEVMCYICFSNKKFSSNTNLVNHLHQHEKEKLYQCYECNKCFNTKASLQQHRKLHEKDSHCNLCPSRLNPMQD